MSNLLLGILIAAIVGFAGGYIIKAKKQGRKCIGCSSSCSCCGQCGQHASQDSSEI